MKALLLIGLAACHSGGDKPRSNRGSGVAPIEVVNQPQFPDAGGRASGASGDEIERYTRLPEKSEPGTKP